MIRYFLTKISIEGFRGINNENDPLVLKFRPDSVNSVFAQNGTGKSSIFEALHYAIKGTVPRLEDMQAAERPDAYLTNLFHTGGTASIKLTLSPDDGGRDVAIEVSLGRDGVRTVASSSGYNDPESLLAALDEDFALMDYATFRRFIEDTALERGRSFSGLLGLSSYANIRRSLRLVENTQSFNADFHVPELDTKVTTLRRDKSKFLDQLKTQFQIATGSALAGDETLWREALLKSLAAMQLAVKMPPSLSDVNFSEVREVLLEAEGGHVRRQLLALADEQASLANIASESPAAAANRTEISGLLTKLADAHEATDGAHFHRLQEAADAFLRSSDDWDKLVCPLCGSRLNTAIDDVVANKLSGYQVLRDVVEDLRVAVTEGELLRRLATLEEVKNLEESPKQRESESLRKAASSGLSLEDLHSASQRIAVLESLLVARKVTVAAEVSQFEQKIPPSLVHLATQITAVEAAHEALIELARVEGELVEAENRLAALRRWKTFTSAALSVFSTAETELVGRTLDDLRSEYQDTFGQIMVTQDIVPELSRTGNHERLAVDLASFHNQQGVSARALLSESFRNALAISVYLSAAIRHDKAPRFVVLDDATSSFDSGHQFHLMEAIRTRFQQPRRPDGVQFIILSHDVTLEKYFDRLNGEMDWYHQKLQGWPPYSPVSSHGQQPDRLRLDAEGHLRAGRTSEGAGLIRQYLEFTLQKVIRQVRIPVPLDLAVNDHSRMVQSCLDAITYAVDIHAAAHQLIMTSDQVADLKTRHSQAIVANWVSHYGTAGATAFSPATLLGILDSIDSLQRCFQYDESGSGAGPWKFYKSLKARE